MKARSRRAEMTLNVVILIVLGLIILAVMGYIFWNKSKNLSSATSCESSMCKASTESCGTGYVKSFTSCKTTDSKGDTVSGRCCVPEE